MKEMVSYMQIESDITKLIRRIGIDLDKDELNSILYHSSYQPQDRDLFLRNKAYATWGRSIILAAYSLYLFQSDRNLSGDEFSKKMRSVAVLYERAIYSKYRLEEFVIKSTGEAEGKHSDISYKLLVIIYQQYGFLKVYDFLIKFFSDSTIRFDNTDYKTLVQEFAARKKCVPIYKVLLISGPAHEMKYTCQVSVGNMTAKAEAVGKKKAEKGAARNLVFKYHISTKQTDERKKLPSGKRIITKQRKKNIDDVIKLLKINPKYVSYSQMDDALTHRSYLNEHKNLGKRCNSLYSIVGANILSMIGIEYVLENINLSRVNCITEGGRILDEENLGRAIPEKIKKYILTNESSNYDNKRPILRFKISVFQSIVAILWGNGITNNDENIIRFSIDFIKEILRKSSKNDFIDYKTFFQIIATKNKWNYIYSYKGERVSSSNQTIHTSKITVKYMDWSEQGEGAGPDKSKSENNAVKDVLPYILPHLDKDDAAAVERMLDPELLFEYEKKQCNNDEKNRLDSQDDVDNTAAVSNESMDYRCTTKKGNNFQKEILFDGTPNILYICRENQSCKRKKHLISSVTGILSSLTGKPIKININYCLTCKIYFISLNEYKYYRDLYGILLGNIKLDEQYSYSGLAEESILKISGYSVSQTDGLTTDERRVILANLMDNNIVSKYRISNYLQFFINNSKYRYNMRIANQKWNDDLRWVRDYKVNNHRRYITKDIN